ncbi:MAG: NTP transferase domain-containing protein [Candidatus Thalassarchaeaceae archaeon]|nr:NTP transferase domain-containing protein [Candidatus Thalassarchaeaceae archaeon]
MRCIVLAAGASSRLGQPKALVKIGQKTLIEYIVERLEAKNLEPVIVTRSDIVVDIMTALPERTIVINPNPEAGRTGSLQCGLKQILDTKGGEGAFRLLVVPVDRPGFSNSTLNQLLTMEICSCPSKDGRGGHPLLLMPEDIARIRCSQPDTPLRNLCTPERFEVADEWLHVNIDEVQDLDVLNSISSYSANE